MHGKKKKKKKKNRNSWTAETVFFFFLAHLSCTHTCVKRKGAGVWGLWRHMFDKNIICVYRTRALCDHGSFFIFTWDSAPAALVVYCLAPTFPLIYATNDDSTRRTLPKTAAKIVLGFVGSRAEIWVSWGSQLRAGNSKINKNKKISIIKTRQGTCNPSSALICWLASACVVRDFFFLLTIADVEDLGLISERWKPSLQIFSTAWQRYRFFIL